MVTTTVPLPSQDISIRSLSSSSSRSWEDGEGLNGSFVSGFEIPHVAFCVIIGMSVCITEHWTWQNSFSISRMQVRTVKGSYEFLSYM